MASSRHNADSIDPRPEVIVRRDAGVKQPASEADLDEPVYIDEELAPEPPLDEFPVDPPETDAAVVDPVTDAALPAPPLTAAPIICAAGAYIGTFRGELRALNGVVRIDVVGTVRFELPGAEAQKLVLDAGTLEGTDAEGHPIKATLAGTVACDTGVVEGKISEGSYTRPDPVFRTLTTTARFSGAVTGSFVAGDRPTGKGSWTVENDRSTRSGSGSFEVQLAK